METVCQRKSIKAGGYIMLGLDHGIQVLLFWAIVACAITVYGLVISALLMIPWGVIQVMSALYNTFDKWDKPVYRSHYMMYWCLVTMVAVLFGTTVLLPYETKQYCWVAGMILSAGIGCYHTYIIHQIYISRNK